MTKMSLLVLIGQNFPQEEENLKMTGIPYSPWFQFIISQTEMEPSLVGFESKIIENLILLCKRLEAYCNPFSLQPFPLHRGAWDQGFKAQIDMAQLYNFGLDCWENFKVMRSCCRKISGATQDQNNTIIKKFTSERSLFSLYVSV